MSVENVIDLIKRMRRSSKYAFLSAALTGFMAHGYVFANKLPNSDDIINIRAYGAGVPHGCWLKEILGPIIGKFAGNYSTPWMIGTVSILLLAMSAVVIVETLGVESLAGGIVLGGVITSFPSVTGNFLFMYVAVYFSLSILLASVAVYLIIRGENTIWTLAGIALIACSMGLYQAYFPYIAGLMMCDLIRRCFFVQDSVKEIWKAAIKYLVCLVAGMALYFAIEYLCLWIFHMSLSTHKGIDKMGHIDFLMIPGLIVEMYRNMASMLHSDYMGISSDLMMRILIGISYLTIIGITIISVIRLIRVKEYLKAGSGILFIIIFPVAINLIDIMCANSGKELIYVIMEYALSLIFILPIILLDSVKKTVAEWGVLLCGTGIIYCYANLANEAYLYVDLAQRSVESYYTVMLAEIRGAEGYRSDLDIVFVGNVKDATVYPLRQEFPNLGISSMEDVTDRVNWYRENFLKYYCGFTAKYAEAYDERYETVVTEMPCYPDYGSIRVLGDQVIVKLSD